MNSVETLIRAAYVFGQDPKVSNIMTLLSPVISLASELQGKTKGEIIDVVVAGIDPLIGDESNAMIGGPENVNALVKVDIPLTDSDGKVIEFSSDLLLEVLAKELKKTHEVTPAP